MVLNAAAAILVGGKAGDFAAGVVAAQEAIDSGRPLPFWPGSVSFTGQSQ